VESATMTQARTQIHSTSF